MVCDAIALAAGPLGLKEALGNDGDLQVGPACLLISNTNGHA
jgi:hypothetical protein